MVRPMSSLPTWAAMAVESPRRENPTAALAAFPPASTVSAYSKGTLPPKGRSIQCPWSSSQMRMCASDNRMNTSVAVSPTLSTS